jgi:hypothetical protein
MVGSPRWGRLEVLHSDPRRFGHCAEESDVRPTPVDAPHRSTGPTTDHVAACRDAGATMARTSRLDGSKRRLAGCGDTTRPDRAAEGIPLAGAVGSDSRRLQVCPQGADGQASNARGCVRLSRATSTVPAPWTRAPFRSVRSRLGADNPHHHPKPGDLGSGARRAGGAVVKCARAADGSNRGSEGSEGTRRKL